MEPLQIAAIAQATRRTGLASSALPGAPVVPHRPARGARLRAGAARALHGLADIVAPQVAPERRRPACTEVRAH